MAEAKQRITLHLGIHTVPMTVDRDREEIFRLAAKQLNDLYAVYLSKFPKATAEQMWMYVALELAVEVQDNRLSKPLEPIEQRLAQLVQRIQTSLEENDNLIHK